MQNTIDISTFVNTVFEGLGEGEAPIMTRPASKGWHNHAATESLMRRIESRPDSWYVCIASAVAPQEGRYKRDRTNLVAAYAVLCDDVGTKAERSHVPYSYELESSEGNLQCVWLIDPYPLDTEAGRQYFEACVRAIGAAGLSDEGAGGAYRVMRVPGSVHRSGFSARITSWTPEVSYDLSDLMDQLGLEPEYKAAGAEAVYDGEVPDDVKDPVSEWLQATGRLGGYNGTWHVIQCPWAHNHSDGVTEAGYAPLGKGEYPLVRGFNCFHQHCTQYGIRDFLAWVQQNDGPVCEVSGVREFAKADIETHAAALDIDQRVELMALSVPHVMREMLPDCDWGEKGPLKAQMPTAANVQKVMEICGIRARSNVQVHDIECDFIDPQLNALAGEGAGREARQLARDRSMTAGIRGFVDDVINVVGMRREYSPICEWIDSVEWDGEQRFSPLVTSVKVEEGYEALWRVYLRRWLIQSVQAFHNWQGRPVAIEHVLGLIGPQGCGKTTWCGTLVPHEFFTRGAYLNIGKGASGDRDAIRLATATPIVELGELETTFSKSADGHQKNHLSKTEDSYRPSHGRSEVTYARTTSYVATANRKDILTDPSGSRRYWLVAVESCDIFHHVDMQQLWAEAKTWWKAGEQWHLSTEEEQLRKGMATFFEYVSPVEDLVASYLHGHEGGERPMNASMVLQAIEAPASNANSVAAKEALTRLLGESRTVRGLQRAWMIPTLPRQFAPNLEVVAGDQP